MSALTPLDLVGSWELVRFEITYSDGRAPLLPFGADAQGQLIYTEHGHMSAVLSRADRESLSVGLETAGKAPFEARAAAFLSYVSYAGRYRLEGETVIHELSLSLVPDSVGSEHARRIQLSNDELVLTYERTPPSGVVRRYALSWKRHT